MSSDERLANRSGTTLGHYRLEELLGRGGMGQVYRATDTRKGRVVALKLLNPDLADNAAFRSRFERESRVAATLNDPHVVPIHDWGEIDGLLYIDMRLVNGRDLHGILTTAGPFPAPRALHVLAQIADALDTAHAGGLVHRDVKPDNILVDARDFAYLADFGLAQAQTDTRLTTAGGTIGTFAYMAPERFGANDVGPAGDVYALACVLYETLSGNKPFAWAVTVEQLITAHLTAAPPVLGSPIDPVIARGMAKDPSLRFATAGALIEAARTAYGTSSGHSRNSIPTLVAPGSGSPDAGATFTPAQPPAGGPIIGFRADPPGPPRRRGSTVVVPLIAALLLAMAIVAGTSMIRSGTDSVGSATRIPDNQTAAGRAAPATPAPTTLVATYTAETAPSIAATPAVPTAIAAEAVAADAIDDAPPTVTATVEPVTSSTAPTPTVAARGAFDLGLPTPISQPACDGTGIVVVGNAVDQATYATEVQSYLTQYPGSRYLRTDQSCSSLRDRDDYGNVIYAVYVVAGRSVADICQVRNQLGGSTYGKWLDNTTDPTTYMSPSDCGA